MFESMQSASSNDPARRQAKREALQALLKQMHSMMSKGHSEDAMAPKGVEAEIEAGMPKHAREMPGSTEHKLAQLGDDEGANDPTELDDSMDSGEEQADAPDELAERKKAFFQGRKAPPSKGSMVVASLNKAPGKPRFGKKG